MSEKLGSLEGQAIQLGNLGACYQTQGNIPKAIDFLQRSLAMHEKLGSLEGQAIQLGHLGLDHLTEGDIPKAIDFLQRSLACYRKMGLPGTHPYVGWVQDKLAAAREQLG